MSSCINYLVVLELVVTFNEEKLEFDLKKKQELP